MTKTTREIEKQKNSNVLTASVIISLLISVTLFLMIGMIFYSEINDLKENIVIRICHNESKMIEIECPIEYNWCSIKDIECINTKNRCFENVTREVCEIK